MDGQLVRPLDHQTRIRYRPRYDVCGGRLCCKRSGQDFSQGTVQTWRLLRQAGCGEVRSLKWT